MFWLGFAIGFGSAIVVGLVLYAAVFLYAYSKGVL